jgi:hypothetical protein
MIHAAGLSIFVHAHSAAPLLVARLGIIGAAS